MDWSNRFTLGGFTVTYCTFEMAWEVVEERIGYEVAFRWFYSKKKAEAFCIAGMVSSHEHCKKVVAMEIFCISSVSPSPRLVSHYHYI